MKSADIVVIGGGPAGSTAGAVLRKYHPKLSVTILERERFPRDHVGESQLPPIGRILDEIGCWDKVEAAGFPIKIGATYRWGTDDRLWDFEFVPPSALSDHQRPGQYDQLRKQTAWQVDRAIYDKILLDHAEELGCTVRQETRVSKVDREGDRVTGLHLDSGEVLQPKWVIDASGHAGIVRRAMEIETECPTSLQNVAFWDYWENAEWVVEIGSGVTRVLVLSIGWGWIWFIPLGPTRTSVGLVVPAQFYKESGKRPAELYAEALDAQPRIRELLRNATSENNVRGTKDWSFVANRMAGENWFLAGESCGFADPILAAGMTLAQASAREAAYTIMAIERDEHDPLWLKSSYSETQSERIRQHIRFADFWYSANGCFTDLKDYTREIARDAGLSLDADRAFQWLGTGGFVTENLGTGLAGYPLGGVRDVVELMLGESPKLHATGFTRLRLNMDDAVREVFPNYKDGKVSRLTRYRREDKLLPMVGPYRLVVDILRATDRIDEIIGKMIMEFMRVGFQNPDEAIEQAVPYIETMIRDGWILGEHRAGDAELSYELPRLASTLHPNRGDVVA